MGRVALLGLVRIVDWVIEGDILLTVAESLINIWRKNVANNNKSIFSLHLICHIIERVPLVDSMQDRSLNMSTVVVDDCNLKVIVSFSRYDYILDIKVGIVNCLYIADSNKGCIVWHMKIIVF